MGIWDHGDIWMELWDHGVRFTPQRYINCCIENDDETVDFMDYFEGEKTNYETTSGSEKHPSELWSAWAFDGSDLPGPRVVIQ
jgi:hypothetical protein